MDGLLTTIMSVVDLSAILELPWYVGITGVLAAGLLVWSALWSLITFKIVRAFTRLILAFAILVILSQGGEAIMQLIGTPSADQ